MPSLEGGSSFLVLVVLIAGHAMGQSLPAETVALSGRVDTLGPGLGTGVTFSTFGVPAINSAGQVSSLSTLTGSTVNSLNDSLVWTGVPGLIVVVVRENDQAAGTTPGVLFSFGNTLPIVSINSAGAVAFFGGLRGAGVTPSNNIGLWSQGTGPLLLLARSGFVAPGANGLNFAPFTGSVLYPAILADTGVVSFAGALAGAPGDADLGVWNGAPLQLVAREASPAPGMGAGATFGILPPVVASNASGTIAFNARGQGGSGTSDNDAAIWMGPPGALQLVVREGDPAPGSAFDFTTLRPPFLSDSGRASFVSLLSNNTTSGIWIASPQSTALVALEGDHAPGLAPGVVFSDLTLPAFGTTAAPVLNRDGVVAFTAQLSGPNVNTSNCFGIWSGLPGSLALVARSGDPAPGTGPGVVFSILGAGANQFPRLNAHGQIAFLASLSGTGVGNSNDLGLWMHTPERGLALVVREGDHLLCQDGVARTVSGFTFSSPMFDANMPLSGVSSSLADNGWVCYAANFTDGIRGVFRVRINAGCFSCCPADLDDGSGSGQRDGAVTIDDLLFFLVRFEAGNASVDLDNDGDPTVGTPDGAVTIDDLLFFLARFEAGC